MQIQCSKQEYNLAPWILWSVLVYQMSLVAGAAVDRGQAVAAMVIARTSIESVVVVVVVEVVAVVEARVHRTGLE